MKECILSAGAPAALGPYSHAVCMEGIVFVSGQLGICPQTGALCQGVAAQAEQALVNLQTVLKDCGASMQDVVKTTVFVKDLADFKTVNEIYAQHFPGDFPARSCVQVAALPAGALVEIEAVAFKSADEQVTY